MDRMPLPAGSYRIIFSLISFGSLYGVSGNDLHPWRVGGSGARRVTETARANDTEQFAAVSSAIYPVRGAPGALEQRDATRTTLCKVCICAHLCVCTSHTGCRYDARGFAAARWKRERDSARKNKSYLPYARVFAKSYLDSREIFFPRSMKNSRWISRSFNDDSKVDI